uniref:SEC63 domain-containing protein n=1 Tax=Heterorhabditis bacteriophora TaxID=37862 RepID=A0A1I7XEW2_HETBA
MFVQALWPRNSPLLQLPHLSEYNLQHLRKSRVYSCGDLAAMDGEKRRAVLKSLSDQQYRDVLVVLSSMPRLSIQTMVVVEGEDDAHEVTAGCVVTLKVQLTRSSLLDPLVAGLEDQRMLVRDSDGELSAESDVEEECAEGHADKDGETKEVKPKRKPWEKSRPQKKKGGAKKRRKTSISQTDYCGARRRKKEDTAEKKDDDDTEGGSGSSSDGAADNNGDESDADDDWHQSTGKKVSLEAKSHHTHPVHCPYFPCDKFEWWLVEMLFYFLIFNFNVRFIEVELRFPAPGQKGIYHYTLAVRSDSYMDADYSKDIK